MTRKKNFFKQISEYIKEFFRDCDGALLSLQGVFVRNGEVVNVNTLRG